VPTAIIDGIHTRFDVIGSGPPLLMMSPGGFDATIEKWRTQGVYTRLKLLDHLPRDYSCIVYDRRESGESGGRVEPITWAHYVAHAKGLLDHLAIARAHVMGACMGCSPAMAFAVAHPDATASLVLYWPVGGAKYRINNHQRFANHLDFVESHSMAEVAARAISSGKTFGEDPRGGPWASVLRREPAFAESFAALDHGKYKQIVSDTSRALYDRDTAPGAEPEELMRLETPALIVPGKDASHATSAARYLEECLPRSEYWDVPPEGQTGATAPARVLEFLQEIKS
jgi:pimeloyl-ACP methyl ester carboxylesterase